MTPAPETGRTAEENVFERRTGMVFETDPETGQQVCTSEGIVTWSSAWPPEARARIEAAEAEAAQLRSRLLQAENDLRFKTAVVDTLSTGIGDARRLTNGWAKGTLLLLPFVDMAAGEGLELIEQEDGSPRMDAADLCAAFAKAMGCELGDAAYTALLAEGRDAIRALNPNQEAGDGNDR